MEKKINIEINKVHLWAATAILLFTIVGAIISGIVTVKETYDQVAQNKEELINHELRLKKVENTVNDIGSTIKTINELKISLDEFRAELEDSRKEWTKLYRDFDLKKK